MTALERSVVNSHLFYLPTRPHLIYSLQISYEIELIKESLALICAYVYVYVCVFAVALGLTL